MTQPVLEVGDLHLGFPGYEADVHTLNHVSLHINRGEVVGVVGESDSGRPVTVMLTMRLLPEGSYRIHQGHVSLLGEDMLNASEKQMHQWCGVRVAMIFQGPMTALGPTRRIGQQMVKVVRYHQALSRTDVRQKAIALLEEVQIPDVPEVVKWFPFKFSDSMRQRMMITLASSYEPELITVDEPTTALDVTMQLQVLRLLKLKAHASGTAVLFISHDVAVVSQLCDRLYVICTGNVIENGPTQTVIQRPTHPYSIGLLKYTPKHGKPRTLLPTIPGIVPNLACLPAGYAFRERCFAASSRCEETPVLSGRGGTDQQSACWYLQLETAHV